MSRVRVLGAASIAALSICGLSARSAHANPLLRLDIDSDNLAEQSNSNAGYSATEGGPNDGSTTATLPPFESWKIDGGLGTVDDPDFGDPRFNQPVYTGPTATPSQYKVTLKASGSEKIDSVRRFGMPAENAGSYYNELIRDFAQVTRVDTSVLPTMDVTVENNSAVAGSNLLPNHAYNVTVWAYDKFFDPGGNNSNDTAMGNTTMHFADTTAEGLGSQSDSYMFNRLTGDDQSLPNGATYDNYTWSTTMTVFTDASGKFSLREVAQTGIAGIAGQPGQGATISQVAAFLNGLEVNDTVNQAVAGASTFANPAAWTGGTVPSGASAVANFFNEAGGTLTLGVATKVGSVNFSGAGGYTINGGGNTLTLESFKGPNSSVSLAARTGSHTINANLQLNNRAYANVSTGATLTVTGDITTGSNVYASQALFLRKTGGGTLVLANASLPTVDIQGGTLRTTRGVTKVNNLIIGANAQGPVYRLDLTGGAWAVDYTGASPAAAIDALITSGRANGFTGTGITSSLAASNPRYTIGSAEASALNVTTVPGFASVPVDSTTFLFRATLLGDATLDGTVNFADLVVLAQNYNKTGRTFIQGDTNYSGTVDFTDLVSLAQNYNQSAINGEIVAVGDNGAFTADWALAQSLVPEPTSLTALGLAAVAGMRRRL